MKKLKKKNWLLIKILLLVTPLRLVAQDANQKVEMADQFRADGKIYIVVLVMMIIILGLSLFAFRIDRKVSKLEKRLDLKND